MDKIYSNDNSIEQISNDNQDTLPNAESYSNVKYTETLNEIFKSDEYFLNQRRSGLDNNILKKNLDIVKHLLGNVLKKNKIKIPTLEQLLQQIEKSKKEIIDGEIL